MMRSARVLLFLATTAAAESLTFEPYTLKTFDGRETTAEIGRLPVAPDIRIAFLRLKSRAPKPGLPILFLMGGAGRGIVMGQIPPFYRIFNQLRDLGEVLLLDRFSAQLALCL